MTIATSAFVSFFSSVKV